MPEVKSIATEVGLTIDIVCKPDEPQGNARLAIEDNGGFT